ncbi:hypothetical protein Hanom_Chr15g01370101 [Helianthus anomalus]
MFKNTKIPDITLKKWIELTSQMKMARFQTFWIQMRKNKPLNKSRKSSQSSGTKMAFYSKKMTSYKPYLLPCSPLTNTSASSFPALSDLLELQKSNVEMKVNKESQNWKFGRVRYNK